MELIYIAAVAAVVLLVCGCAGAVAIVIPALDNELPASQAMTTNNPAVATDPVVGTWEMVDPVVQDGRQAVYYNDSRWTFGADGSYRFNPLLIDLFKTTGTWTKVGEDRYEIVSGKDSRVEHYRLIDGRLCQEEDIRYVLVGA